MLLMSILTTTSRHLINYLSAIFRANVFTHYRALGVGGKTGSQSEWEVGGGDIQTDRQTRRSS